MGVEEMRIIGEYIHQALENRDNETYLFEIRKKVRELAKSFPLYLPPSPFLL
jgi:glycine/serine hydroxymethyltransferase